MPKGIYGVGQQPNACYVSRKVLRQVQQNLRHTDEVYAAGAKHGRKQAKPLTNKPINYVKGVVFQKVNPFFALL